MQTIVEYSRIASERKRFASNYVSEKFDAAFLCILVDYLFQVCGCNVFLFTSVAFLGGMYPKLAGGKKEVLQFF